MDNLNAELKSTEPMKHRHPFTIGFTVMTITILALALVDVVRVVAA